MRLSLKMCYTTAMNILRIISDGLLIFGLIAFTHIKREKLVIPAGVMLMILQTIEIWLLYRGQEDSSFFFLHAYISWLLASLIFFACKKKKDLIEHLIILPLIVLPIISGFELCIGWILKLYGRYFLPQFML